MAAMPVIEAFGDFRPKPADGQIWLWDNRAADRIENRLRSDGRSTMGGKIFLFLQGPVTPFFAEVADALEARGNRILRINLCLGDRLFWRRAGATNYRGSLSRWPAFIADFLDRNGVSHLILMSEQRDYHQAAIKAAKARGISIAVTDFGYLRPDWITLERDGMNGASIFTKDPEAIRAIARNARPVDLALKYHDSFLNQAVWDVVYQLSQIFFPLLYPRYRTHQLHNPVLYLLGTGRRLLVKRRAHADAARVHRELVANKQPYYLLPLQMETDYQIRAYSDFPDLTTAIRTVVQSFAVHAPADAHLLIKNHPLDPGLRSWRKRSAAIAAEAGVSDRVHYVDGGDLDAMLIGARGTVMVNSTVGLRALVLGCPVQILGTAIYDVPGMVSGQTLDDFWANPRAPDPELVKAYINAIAATIQMRGVYFSRPGLNHVVAETAHRLDNDLLNVPLDTTLDSSRQ